MKKKLLTATALSVAAIALVVCTVFVTVAYLTASSGVSNVFTVGNVSITMFETKVDSAGKPVSPAEKVITNTYHLVPETTYMKDPTIQVTSLLEKDEMYLFVKSSNRIRAAEDGNVIKESANKTMRQQMIDNGWVEYVRSGDGVEIVWVYGTRNKTTGVITPTRVNPTKTQKRGDGSTGPAGEFRLCEEFTIHKDANVSLYDGFSVDFTAFAIQTSGLDTVHKAWTGVKETYPSYCGIADPVNPYKEGADPYAPVENVDGPEDIN